MSPVVLKEPGQIIVLEGDTLRGILWNTSALVTGISLETSTFWRHHQVCEHSWWGHLRWSWILMVAAGHQQIHVVMFPWHNFNSSPSLFVSHLPTSTSFSLTGDFSRGFSSNLDSQRGRAALECLWSSAPPPRSSPAVPLVLNTDGASAASMCWPTLTLWFNAQLVDLAHRSSTTCAWVLLMHRCTHTLSLMQAAHTPIGNSDLIPTLQTHTHTLSRRSLQSELGSTDLTLNSFKGGEDDVLHETNFYWTS